MGKLSKRGIDKLEKIMLANAKNYNQDSFGDVNNCGTFMCAAGFARFLKVGKEQFDKEAKIHSRRWSQAFADRCVKDDGKELLGIKSRGFPDIFEWSNIFANYVPNFDTAKTNRRRVQLYIKALRTQVDDKGNFNNDDFAW